MATEPRVFKKSGTEFNADDGAYKIRNIGIGNLYALCSKTDFGIEGLRASYARLELVDTLDECLKLADGVLESEGE